MDLEPEKLLKANLGPTLPQIEQLKDIANGSNAHEGPAGGGYMPGDFS